MGGVGDELRDGHGEVEDATVARGHVLVEDVFISSEHQRHGQDTEIRHVEGVPADTERLGVVVWENGVRLGKDVGVGGVFERNGDKGRVLRAGAAIDGQCRAHLPITMSGSDRVGSDTFG